MFFLDYSFESASACTASCKPVTQPSVRSFQFSAVSILMSSAMAFSRKVMTYCVVNFRSSVSFQSTSSSGPGSGPKTTGTYTGISRGKLKCALTGSPSRSRFPSGMCILFNEAELNGPRALLFFVSYNYSLAASHRTWNNGRLDRSSVVMGKPNRHFLFELTCGTGRECYR